MSEKKTISQTRQAFIDENKGPASVGSESFSRYVSVMGGASQDAGTRPDEYRVEQVFNSDQLAQMEAYGWDREEDPNAVGWLTDAGYDVPEYLAFQQEEYNDFDQHFIDKVLANPDMQGMLHLSFEPEDMLDMADNADSVYALMHAGDGNGTSLRNASPAMVRALVDTGLFENVMLTGHGSDEGIFGSNQDGESELMDPEMLAAMLGDSAVQNVMLAGCGTDSLAAGLADHGMNAFGWQGQLEDENSWDLAKKFANYTVDQDTVPLGNQNAYGHFAKQPTAAQQAYGRLADGSSNASVLDLRASLQDEVATRRANGTSAYGHAREFARGDTYASDSKIRNVNRARRRDDAERLNGGSTRQA